MRTIIAQADKYFVEKLPFNQTVGFNVQEYGEEPLKLRIASREQLFGNYSRQMLHGGVIMSCIDAVGGMQVLRQVLLREKSLTHDKIHQSLSKISTIDLSVQFIRPGIGDSFYACAIVKRLGQKVAFVNMEMFNQQDKLIATGAGVFNVS